MTRDGVGGWPRRTPPPDSLPAQAGHSGEYLTTDGATAAWGRITPAPAIPLTAYTIADAGAAWRRPRNLSVRNSKKVVAYEYDDGPLRYFCVWSISHGKGGTFNNMAGTALDWNSIHVHAADDGTIFLASAEDDAPYVFTFTRPVLYEQSDGTAWWNNTGGGVITPASTDDQIWEVEALCGDPAGNVVVLLRAYHVTTSLSSVWVVWIKAGNTTNVDIVDVSVSGANCYAWQVQPIDPDDATGPVQVAGSYFNGTDYTQWIGTVDQNGLLVTNISQPSAAADNKVQWCGVYRGGRYIVSTGQAATAPAMEYHYWWFNAGKPDGAFRWHTTDSTVAEVWWLVHNEATGSEVMVLNDSTNNAYYVCDIDRHTVEVSNVYRLSSSDPSVDVNNFNAVEFDSEGVMWAGVDWADSTIDYPGVVALPRDGRTYTLTLSGATVTWEPVTLPTEVTISAPTGGYPDQYSGFALGGPLTFSYPSYNTAFYDAPVGGDTPTPTTTQWTAQ